MQSTPDAGPALYQDLIDSIGDACLVVDEDMRIRAANAAAEALYGRTLAGTAFAAVCDGGGDEVIARVASCGEGPCTFDAAQLRADGSAFNGHFSAKRCAGAFGHEVISLLIVRELRGRLERCEEKLALHTVLLENLVDGVVAHTLDGELVFANSAALAQWGADDLESIRARGPFGWIAPRMRASASGHLADIVEAGQSRFESAGDGPDGMPVEIHSHLVETPLGKLVLSCVRDVSERMATEEMVRYLAYHDTLTGLANRVLLEQELNTAISEADRHGDVLGTLWIDLDRFKPVNDTFGHAVGDEVLREIADRLSGSVRDTDTVARTGGDEFVVVLPRLNSADDLQRVANKLAQEVERPIDLGGREIRVSASIGLAIHRVGENAESLMTRADLAMYDGRRSESREAVPFTG